LGSVTQIILNGLLFHFVLAKVCVKFIIIARYVVHKINKWCLQFCHCSHHVSSTLFVILLLMTTVIIGFIIYFGGMNEHRTSSNMFQIQLSVFISIIISLVLLVCGLLQSNLYEHYNKCSFYVIDE
jgi:hypothetical protein